MNNKAHYFGKAIFTAIFALVISAINISAATFTVTNTNDTGAGSLRQAVTDANAAATADTIVFDSSFNVPRTITLATVIAINVGSSVDSLTITGPGANLLTIRSSGSGSVRIFQHSTNDNFADTANISGITFAQSLGGNILNWAILNVSNCAFVNNTTSVVGVGISNAASASNLTVDNSVFSGNTGGGGSGGSGGAIFNDGTATVTNSTFSSNTIGFGGAISNGGSLSVSGCTFTNNTVNSSSATGLGGGAIYSNSSVTPIAATITNSTFIGNAEAGGSGGGGAIRNRGGTMNISGSTFTSNTAIVNGGAVRNTGVMNINSSTFTDNSVTGLTAASGHGNGGGIGMTAGQLTVTNSLITGNRAVNNGGGIYYDGNSGGDSMTVTNSTISNNIANSDNTLGGNGGGFRIEGFGTKTVTSSTISGNRVNGNGGGFSLDTIVSLHNSIIANNSATVSGQDAFGSTISSLGYNLIRNTTGATISGTTTGNITGVDPLLGPLSYNGGATRTHALLNGSPAIDTGDPTTFPAADQRGITRPQDGNGDSTARADIGAYERRLSDVPIVGDFDADGKADPGVFPPSTLTWYISKSSGGTIIQTFGANGDLPVVADYDGDGRSDIAIYRPSVGEWWIQRSSNNSVYAFQFGVSTDKPVQGDYTGDGKADAAVFRPSTGFWFILRSEDNSFYSVPFGANGDSPSPGDYDGDGKFDTAVFRPSNSTWFVQRSTAGTLIQAFGIAGDLPIPNAFVP